MKSTSPTLSFLYLPNVTGPHQAWLNHPMIYRLATLDLPLHTPNHSWNGLPPHTPTSKGGGTLYIVANTQGTQTYLLPQWKTLIERISPHNTGTRRIRAPPPNFGDPTRQGLGVQPNGLQPPSSLNKCWNKLYPTTPSQPATLNTPSPTPNLTPLPSLPQHATPLHITSPAPKRWIANNYVYTDGSCKAGTQKQPGTHCGAGVYVAETGNGYTVLPAGQGLTNTINRAELSGILAALTEVIPPHKDTAILSDSLCSLLQIHKTLRSPMSMARHLHKQLIWDIVKAIQNSSVRRDVSTYPYPYF